MIEEQVEMARYHHSIVYLKGEAEGHLELLLYIMQVC